MLDAMRKEFEHLKLTFSIGGMISFDVFPNGQSTRSPTDSLHCPLYTECKVLRLGQDVCSYTRPRRGL